MAANGPEIRRAPEMLLVFRTGELCLGIDVRDVSEVTRAMELSAPLPQRSGVIGMITLRGMSTPVIDLATVLGVPVGSGSRMIAVRHGKATVGLRVDAVEGLRAVSGGALEPPPPILADREAWWLDSVLRSRDGELVGVMSVSRVLSSVAVEADVRDPELR